MGGGGGGRPRYERRRPLHGRSRSLQRRHDQNERFGSAAWWEECEVGVGVGRIERGGWGGEGKCDRISGSGR